MLLTTSAKTRLPRHSTGWRAIRIVTDRAGKNQPAGPADWIKAKHRAITLDDAAQMIAARIRSQHSVHALHSRR